MRKELRETSKEAHFESSRRRIRRARLATEMAERGATEEELMNWFDWDRYETAHKYVKGGPKLTEKWSRRTF